MPVRRRIISSCLRLVLPLPSGARPREACLEAEPAAVVAADILARLTADFGKVAQRFPQSLTVEQWHGRLVQRVREDFRAGRVRYVEGWMLSATEIRLFSLVALTD
jgi:hypothetical protein